MSRQFESINEEVTSLLSSQEKTLDSVKGYVSSIENKMKPRYQNTNISIKDS